MPIEPQPCGAGDGASDAVDVEQTLLCDVLPNGDIVGSALAVYEYDSEGNPTGAPVFVDPVTGLPYVPQGVLQPCGDTISHAVEILCDVNDADGSSVQFERVKTIGPAGTVLSVADFGLDGAPYVPLNSVQICDPLTTCTPESNQNLNAECGPGEPVVQEVLLADLSNPLANSVFNDDDTADPLCGGTWDRPADALPAGFPVAESFRNTTFDQPGPVVTGQPADLPFLTAGPPTNDGAGAGWLRLADGRGGSNGIWQVPGPFSTSQGMNAAVTLASHDGTTPGGDGQYFVFTDGAAGTQATPIGGFGNLGLNNWTGGVFAVVLDEYGQSCTCGQALPSDPNAGPCGFCSNTISIQRAGASRVGASCACCTIASAPLTPKAINQTTRSQPLRLLTSVISEGGQTYVSASVDWNDGNGPIQYFDRVNITACITVPPTLRMGLSMNSGGAFQAIKEARDAVARPAGVSNWRAFPITTDAIPECVTLVNISASVDVTPNDDGSQTAGNGDPELYFWLVNNVTGTVLDRDQYSIIPSQLGQVQTLSVDASVPPADVPNLRLYVGAESRDDSGEYDTTWENLTVDATGAGCPATPRRTMEISARCPIPVVIVGGGDGEGGGGGTTIVNTPSTFEDVAICATVAGVPQTAFRRELRTPDGGVEVTFLGLNGLPITPDGGWTPGPCAAAVFAGFVCDITPDTPPQPFTRNFAGETDLGTPGVDSFYSLPDGLTVSINAPAPVNGSAIDVPANAQIIITYPAGSTAQSFGVNHFTAPGQLGVNPNPPTSVTGDATLAGPIVDATIADGTADVFLPPSTGVGVQVNNNDVSLQDISYTLAATPGASTQVKQFRQGDGTSFYENLDGTTHTVTGTIGACDDCAPLVLGQVCVTSSEVPGIVVPATAVQACDGTVTYVNVSTGEPWADAALVICPPDNQSWEEILCDAGNNGQQFRRVYNLTPLGSVVQYDEDLGSNPYVVVGPAENCGGDCTSCQTLTLCDFGADVPVLITGISTGGTLSNGVTWSGARGSAANFNPQHNNVDGSWWGMPSFPNSTVAPDTWFFDRPVDVEFSVVIAHSFGTGSGPINQVQVPIGSELISSAPDYSYDAATGIVTVDSSNNGDCTKVTNPTVANSARFVLRNVTQFTLDFLGQRIAICGQFSNWRFGSIAVTPATTTFLRTICRDCDGAIATVTDTEADGTTPYTPIGPVGECGTAADAEPQCFATQICVQPQGVDEFISNEANLTSTVGSPNIDPVWQWSNDPDAGPWFNMYDVGVFPGWVTVDPGTTEGVANWVAPHPNSSPITSGLTGEGPTIGPGNAQWYARAQFTLPANADPASIRIAATVINADQLGVEFRLNNGAWQPVNASHIDPPFSFPAQVIPGAQAGLNEVFVHVQETVFGSGAAGVKMHLIASYNLGDQQSWTQIVCDDGTVSYFTNAGEQTDALPEDWVIVPCGGTAEGTSCPCVSAADIGQAVADAATVPAIRDSESFILCSSTPAPGTQFLRTRVYNELGVVVATVDTTLTGAPFAPGVVSVCATTVTPDTDFLSQVLCDTVGSFLQLQRYNSQTGVLVSTTNLTLTGAAYVPVGAIGACDTCCPVVMGEGCTNVGSLRYTALRLANGTISLIDSVTGAAVLPANIVACAPANGVLPNVAADHFEAVPGTPWTPAAIPAGRRLVSLTYSVLTGTATVVDATGGTSIATIPAGYSASWTAQDDRETLTPPASITSVGGRVIVLMLTAA